MQWIEPIRSRYASTSAIVTDAAVDKDGCEVHFGSFPAGSLILDIDEVINFDDEISAIVGPYKRCDFAILTVQNSDDAIALVEVTDQRTNLPDKIYECMDQLSESYDHLDQTTLRCALPLRNLSRIAVIVAPRQRASMFRSDRFKQLRANFLNNVFGTVSLKFAQCGEDLWDEIQ